ncbi:hypothetical protein DAI22_02g196600 [Oryza sativa Japonica Group]|nr:hypothetical protein DAI22_02g196600 [Oryza sativa Japonica Group]
MYCSHLEGNSSLTHKATTQRTNRGAAGAGLPACLPAGYRPIDRTAHPNRPVGPTSLRPRLFPRPAARLSSRFFFLLLPSPLSSRRRRPCRRSPNDPGASPIGSETRPHPRPRRRRRPMRRRPL